MTIYIYIDALITRDVFYRLTFQQYTYKKWKPTVRITNPGDKVLQLVVVLYDGGDGVAFPLEGEGVDADIVVRKSLYKMQPKHRRHT